MNILLRPTVSPAKRFYCTPVFAPPSFDQGMGDMLRAKKARSSHRQAQLQKQLDAEKWAAQAEVFHVDLDDPAALVHWGGGAAQYEALKSNVTIIPNFVTPQEEQELTNLIDVSMDSQPWETAHADSLIFSYREKYVEKTPQDHPALLRLNEYVRGEFPPLDLYHFLEYTKEGYVRAHFDNEAESSHIVAGLSLCDTRCMTLTREGCDTIEVVLPARSLYVLSGECRYKWLHAVDHKTDLWVHQLPEVVYKGKLLANAEKGRRRCVIVRGAPLGAGKK